MVSNIAYKRGTTPTLPVIIENVGIENVRDIEFLFKQYNSEDATKLVLKKYPDEVTYENDTFFVPFSEYETRLFKENRPFYMDTKITYTGGMIPKTNIVELMMNNTLFSETD